MGSELIESCKVYDFGRAEWIAGEYAGGATLAELSNLHPDIVPGPLVVAGWRRMFPAFDLLMLQASEARAEVLADQTIAIADDRLGNAAHAANGIRARQWLAARLNRARYGEAKHVTITPGASVGDGMASYTDAELQAIIAGALRQGSVAGEVTRIETAPPVAPPREIRPGVETKYGRDLPEPKIFHAVASVTTNEGESDVS